MENKTIPGKEVRKDRKPNRIERAINTLLSPVELSYRAVRKLMEKTHDSLPFVYHEVESLIKSQLVGLEKDRTLLHSPNIEEVTGVIANNIMRKLPNLDEEKVRQIVADKSSKSFLDMLTRGLGSTIEQEKDFTVLQKERLFRKVLIANRGEIALRVIRACKELGIKTVVVYTTHDKDSLAVKFADQSHCIGNTNGYLEPKKIIKIAKKTQADAIHPGYGFLAENADFADLCKKNMIKFIGPSSRTISLLGHKIKAREVMINEGIPVLSGTRKMLDNEAHALEISGKMGYPVMLKAVGGGGGKGMRIIRSKKDFIAGYKSAELEAAMSFGNSKLYLEKYLENPRHIEFQILADQHGNIIHLGERECSIQRRHQKLIEEAPSIALNRKLREKIGNAAVNAVSAVGYQGAGTVEFLLDQNNNFYFIEMNTRIQVEHGVTEMVTGVDLVKEQIKMASGARLAYKQGDIKINGWAIECRINAECPEDEFCPDVGAITNYLPPGGPGIRVCSSCHTGHIVSPHYDSLISKLICGGKTRNEAIARMRRALDEYIIEGVKTTIPFHKVVLNNKQFHKGNISTSFIETNNIIEEIKKQKKTKKKELSKKEKLLIVTTAASKYMENKQGYSYSKTNPWVMAGRQELMNNEDSSF